VPNSILVRAARAQDKDAVLAFCQNTFQWGDYIAEVWEHWLADSRGQLLVGVVNDAPVSIMRVVPLGETAWLEGMRVHPDFRRQGIARIVEAEGRAWARERGCRVARLATSIRNTAAQAMLETIGYRRAAQFNEWDATPTDFSPARIGTPADLPRLAAWWRAADAPTVSALVPDRQWHWTRLDDARWQDHLHAGEVRVAPNGFALLLTFGEREWSHLALFALAGDAETIATLARAARGEAAYRGYAHLEAQIVEHPTLDRALERAGFTRRGGMFIYEMEL